MSDIEFSQTKNTSLAIAKNENFRTIFCLAQKYEQMKEREKFILILN